MALTAGVISLVSSQPTELQLAVTAASGGTGPYTQQWYRSQVDGFTPGGGNILSGETALTLDDDDKIPGTKYFYVVVFTDTGNSNVTVDSAQFEAITAAASPSQNQFAIEPLLGTLDLLYNPDTIAVQVDVSEPVGIYPGQAVKMVDSANGVPKVIACTADADEVLGFAIFNLKNAVFLPGMALEISMDQNVQFLRATAAIARGAQVQSDVSTIGGVAPLSGSSGADIVGFAMDKAVSAGDLIRVKIGTPSFAKA